MIGNLGMGQFTDLARALGSSDLKKFNTRIGDLADDAAKFNQTAQDFTVERTELKKLTATAMWEFGPPVGPVSILAWMPLNNIDHSIQVWAKKIIALRESMSAIYTSIGPMVDNLQSGGLGFEASRLRSSQIAIDNGIEAANSALGIGTKNEYRFFGEFTDEFTALWNEEASLRGTTRVPWPAMETTPYWDALRVAVKRYTGMDLPTIQEDGMGGGMGNLGIAIAGVIAAIVALAVLLGGVFAIIWAYNGPMRAKRDIALKNLDNIKITLQSEKQQLAHFNDLEQQGKITPSEAQASRDKVKAQTESSINNQHKKVQEEMNELNEGGILGDLGKLLIPVGVLAVGGLVISKL